MLKFVRTAAALLLAAAMLAALSGCAKKVTEPKKTAAPTMKPAATDTAEPSDPALPSETALASESPEASQSPDSSGGPVSTEGKLSFSEGFMEGKVVDPDDVPELIELLKNDSRFKDMSIQSVTHKYYEERQAYYVVLQGEGEASHPIYVFADGTIIEETM
jgi:hypothetical protein